MDHVGNSSHGMSTPALGPNNAVVCFFNSLSSLPCSLSSFSLPGCPHWKHDSNLMHIICAYDMQHRRLTTVGTGCAPPTIDVPSDVAESRCPIAQSALPPLSKQWGRVRRPQPPHHLKKSRGRCTFAPKNPPAQAKTNHARRHRSKGRYGFASQLRIVFHPKKNRTPKIHTLPRHLAK